MRQRIILICGILAVAALMLLACAKYSLPNAARDEVVSKAEVQSNAGYDTQYREPTRSMESGAGALAPAAAPGAPPSGGPSSLLSPLTAVKNLDVATLFAPSAYAADTSQGDKYLIRIGEMSVKVENYDKAAGEITRIALAHHGTLTDSHMEKNYDGSRTGYVTLRVPNTEFMTTWSDLAKVGEVLTQNVSTQDVANEYVSAVSQMRNLLKEQETLQGMLDDARQVQRTRGLGEAYKILLDTQQRLAEVSGQIQAIEDRISQLADQITRSTIKVSLTEREAVKQEEFSWQIGDTFLASWKTVQLGIRNTINALISFVVTSVLWVPWVLLAWWLIVVAIRRARRRYGTGITLPPAGPQPPSA